MAVRERYIQVCTNQMPADHPLGCCHDRGAQANLRKLQEELQARGLDRFYARFPTDKKHFMVL